MACMRLTERCADILLSVHAEVHEAGDRVNDELKLPLSKLVEYANRPSNTLRELLNDAF